MDDGLKQRIIGAFVLLALAVIFVPVLFDRERIEPVGRLSKIPPAPDVETIEVALPQRVLPNLPVRKAEDYFSLSEEGTVPNMAQASAAENVPKAWVMLFAKALSRSEAQALQQSLDKKGHASFLRGDKPYEATTFRLFVGPKLDKRRLEILKSELSQQFDIVGDIYPFHP